MDAVHVVPINDLKPHVENGEHCHCKPRIQMEEHGTVVIHNSYDGREFYEAADRPTWNFAKLKGE